MPCERRSLEGSDRKALVAETSSRLKAGELCVLPTETVYGLAVLPSHKIAVKRARALKGREISHPFTWHLARREDLQELAQNPTPRVQKLLDRYWPGPLTVVMPGKREASVGVRQPAHAFTAEVIAACGEPLWLSSVNRSGEPPLLDAEAICARFQDDVDLVVDDGPSPLGTASTVVRAAGAKLEVLREGILSTDEVLRTAADTIIFVCTGNTCRSPLAEALARDLAARQLEIEPDEVLATGLAFCSAGMSTLAGIPASEGSIAAGKELGLDLSSHRSCAISKELLASAAYIYCHSVGHRNAILAEFPEVADRVSMLRHDQLDIADPFGGELQIYRKVRDEIRAAIGARLNDWLSGTGS